MSRVRAFDWLRGLAVVVMVQTHSLALLRPELRSGRFYAALQWIDGLVAPSFILAAGFALALVLARSSAQPGGRARRLRRTLRRLGEVLAVGTLVNWMWFPIFREPRWIFRVDILQCIGVALLLALPALALLAPRPRALRWVALALAALVFAVSPYGEQVRGPLAALANDQTGSVFPLLPWAGYVYLGAALGATFAVGGARATAVWLCGLAAAGAALWMATPQLAAIYPPHHFWVTNPANAARRWTQVSLIALLLLGVEQRWEAGLRASLPVQIVELFGTSSLAAYFFHEMLLFYRLFGLSFDRFFRDRCSWPQYWALLPLLLAMTWALTWLADRLYRRWDRAITMPALRPAA
ncbi:MAG TPA: heparan-alpha-glucosaminide N-acetyltransferase domain-containing protein [Myxococcales bacterium]|nr:heparan-alpha-glucosaminide N-acetyltransferase domain-containing protein [Myxococcales bacterium]